MSPPCQPYTSLSGQADAKDPRSKALSHIFTHVLPSLPEPPLYLAVENVPAFLWSEGRKMVVAALRRLNYDIEEFELCPTLFGVPNKRRRYFLIAKRNSSPRHAAVDAQDGAPPPAHSTLNGDSPSGNDDAASRAGISQQSCDNAKPEGDGQACSATRLASSAYDVKYFLPSLRACTELQKQEKDSVVGDEDLDADQSQLQCLAISREGSVVSIALPPSSSDQVWGRWQPMYVSPLHHATRALPVARFLDNEVQLQSWSAAGANLVITESDLDCISRGTLKVDACRLCSTSSSCFTKGYARILRRAGPLFLQRHPPPASPNPSASIQPLVVSLRRFTPSEQSRLMCLPPAAVAPSHAVSPQNWHKLLGNSINVHVCACVLLHMLRDHDAFAGYMQTE
jgi:site-specific DNA-cytosine methylase